MADSVRMIHHWIDNRPPEVSYWDHVEIAPCGCTAEHVDKDFGKFLSLLEEMSLNQGALRPR
jgi:hypothetical protein